jgi:hypothetical protein
MLQTATNGTAGEEGHDEHDEHSEEVSIQSCQLTAWSSCTSDTGLQGPAAALLQVQASAAASAVVCQFTRCMAFFPCQPILYVMLPQEIDLEKELGIELDHGDDHADEEEHEEEKQGGQLSKCTCMWAHGDAVQATREVLLRMLTCWHYNSDTCWEHLTNSCFASQCVLWDAADRA